MAKVKHNVPLTQMKTIFNNGEVIKRGELAKAKGEVISIKTELMEFGTTKIKKLNMQIELHDGSRIFVKKDCFVNDLVRLFDKETKEEYIDVDLEDVHNYDETHNYSSIKVKGKNDSDVCKEHELVALDQIAEKFEKGDIVYVQGTLDFSTYNPTTFINPRAIYFSEEFKENDLEVVQATKRLVFSDIDKNEEGEIEATMYHVGDREITPLTVIVENKALATNLKKKVKPFTAMDVSLEFINKLIEEEVEIEEDEELLGWGDLEDFLPPKQAVAYINKLTLKGVNPNSFDEETYSEELIVSAIAKLKADKDGVETQKEESEDDGWGDSFDSKKDDNDIDQDFPF